jgi:hypothetical protein
LKETTFAVNQNRSATNGSAYTGDWPQVTGPVAPLGDRPRVSVDTVPEAHRATIDGDKAGKEWDPTPMIEDMYKVR